MKELQIIGFAIVLGTLGLLASCGGNVAPWKAAHVDDLDSLHSAIAAEYATFEQLDQEKTKGYIAQSEKTFKIVEEKNKYSRKHEFPIFRDYRMIFKLIKGYDGQYGRLNKEAQTCLTQLEGLSATIAKDLNTDNLGAKIDSLYIVNNTATELGLGTKLLAEIKRFNERDGLIVERFEKHNGFVEQWIDSVATVEQAL